MDTFLTVLVWGGALFLMMRLGHSRPGKSGQGDSRQPAVADSRTAAETGDLRWLPPEEEVDPICGRTVRTATAKTSVRNGWVYYFCSSACRETFEAGPSAAPVDSRPPAAVTEASHV